jgi:cytochrome c-type protein NapB
MTMKPRITLFVGAALLAGGLCAAETEWIHDDAIGLSKTSVFDDPVPPVFAYSDLKPKKSGVLPRYWDEAPPQIPHQIDKLLPIRAKLNKCMECHDAPDEIGHKVKGEPTPMPESHYVKDGKDMTMANSRHFCNLCHVPQAGVDTLVGNTYGQGQ